MSPVSFLLVDDLEENLLSLEALLRRDGLTLLKARSGDEALELLLSHDVALALVDVQMPGLGGFDLAELMRGNERTRRVPIIFVTAGTTDTQRRFQGYEAGAVDFIQKPIETDILRSKADVFFELYRQRQQIAQQRDELKTHAAALEEADRRKDEFLATLAHELRNPLAPLRHGLDVLRRNPDSAKADDIRDMMDRQMAHLVRLIDDLLDVSRVSQGKVELRKGRIAAGDVIRSALEASQPLIEASGHHLTLDLPTEAVWLDGDLTRLAQVVGNLLNNAAKYTPAGGRIGLSLRAQGEQAVIAVSDNGLGIPPAMQSKIFQLFTQVDDHAFHAQGGLGIGLALVKQLVDMHGGTIAVESAGAGQGSIFTVTTPLAADDAQAQATGPVAEPSPARPLNILIVDDIVEVAQTVGWMLEEMGHGYRMIHDGRLALEAAHDYRPDVILLDIGLPVMDGYEVCRGLRRDPQFATTTIVAQTGWGQSRDKAEAAAAGFDYHLVKPVTYDALEQLLLTLPVRAIPPAFTLRPWSDDLAEAFYRINAEWVQAMFTLEENDIRILSQPRELIIDRGGDILFVETPDLGVVGTCALIKMDEDVFELTKMGVSETARGRKAGEFLLAATLERARAMGIETLYLLTNRQCAAAIHLYEKLGFEHSPEIMARYGSRYERCNVAMIYRW